MDKVVSKAKKPLIAEISVPADKSIAHRSVMFSSLAKGKSIIKNFPPAEDPLSTLEVCKSLGINATIKNSTLEIISNGKLIPPTNHLNCGNSGTTMRLMSGILAGQNFKTILIGDESLSKRPMKRIIEPLTLMGAKINSNNYTAPLEIFGNELHSIEYVSKISSAQVKSAILLAGLFANGKTKFTEPHLSRNHTELILSSMGANIVSENNTVSIEKSELEPINIKICGDISSAAYFIVAALIIPNSSIIIKNIGLNPTRTGIIDILKKMNANIEILNKETIANEEVGDIKVSYSDLTSCEVSGDIIPRLIDEIPIIAVAATQAKGTTHIKDADDLRNKESDRIKAIVCELKKMGADIEETSDGMIIHGKTELIGNCECETYHDHRIAMSLYVAGLVSKKEILIKNFEWVNISFPNFENIFNNMFS